MIIYLNVDEDINLIHSLDYEKILEPILFAIYLFLLMKYCFLYDLK